MLSKTKTAEAFYPSEYHWIAVSKLPISEEKTNKFAPKTIHRSKSYFNSLAALGEPVKFSKRASIAAPLDIPAGRKRSENDYKQLEELCKKIQNLSAAAAVEGDDDLIFQMDDL